MALNTAEELIEDIRAGKMVILMDDEDRENEGDIIIASECVTAEHINFMARFARGLICMPMTRERCELLRLPLMAPRTVNLTALPRMLIRIWRSRFSSARTTAGSSPAGR